MSTNRKIKGLRLLTPVFLGLFILAGIGFENLFKLPFQNKSQVSLESIQTIVRAITLISQHYYDPDRIQPDKMLEASLNSLSEVIPEMLVTFPSPPNNSFTVSLGDNNTTVTYEKPTRLLDLLSPLSRTFDFIKLRYKGKITNSEQQYAVIIGLLNKLDPHSNLMEPSEYKEFMTQTEGEYGGLGLVVNIKDENLVILAPIEDTPAMRAGLKAGDQIAEIDGVSTVNMPIDDAVDRLRGKVGSKVSILIKRDNKDPQEVSLTRQKINIQSVKYVILNREDKRIGVIRIRQFAENTAADISNALKSMMSGGPLAGLVLDLRNNPGGLLEQCLSIADQFLDHGDLVYTVGARNLDEEVSRAEAGNDFLNVPMAVLVNQGSASASEIVAGALKNNNRAVIMGTQTFGKGSVQTIYGLPDNAAIKLTIAQYLTPGRVSIQAVGVSPDISLIPLSTEEANYRLRKVESNYSEKNLDEHLENVALTQESKPLYELGYLAPTDKPEENEYTSKIDDSQDYELSFAVSALAGTKAPTRLGMLEEIKPFIQKEALNEDQKITEALKKNQINWASTPNKAPAQISFSSMPPILQAGRETDWAITATNLGKQEVSRLIGVVKAENGLLNRREFVFGKLIPGETKKVDIKIKVPDTLFSFKENVVVEFFSDQSENIPAYPVYIAITEKPKPQLAYSYSLKEDNSQGSHGNGNGILEPGETAALIFQLSNLSALPGEKVSVNLRSPKGSSVLLRTARNDVGRIEPKSQTTTVLTFELGKSFSEKKADIYFSLFDKSNGAELTDTISIPVGSADPKSFDPPLQELQIAPTVKISQEIVSKKTNQVTLSGEVTDDHFIKDMMIFVEGKKVFYRAAPVESPSATFKFQTNLDLKKGLNMVTIQARDNRNTFGHKYLTFVGSDKPNLAVAF